MSNQLPANSQASQDQPLGLTVHAMPRLDRESASQGPNTASGRWKMLAILLVCAAPVIASYFTYYVVRPEGRRNYGELVDPQRPLPTVSTKALSAIAASNPAPAPDARTMLTDLKGQWLLISVGGGGCEAQCQQHLYFQRQLRESLGREKDRLDWVWLVNDEAAVAPALASAVAGATALRVAKAELAQWLLPARNEQLESHLYLVDPLGNWMMRFPANMDVAGAAKAKRDLERVLRASSSWDNAGR